MALSSLHFSSVKVEQLGRLKAVTGIYTPGASAQAGGTHSYTSGGEVVTQAILKAALGLLEVRFWQFEDLLKSDFTDAARVAFDHARTSSQVGIIHIYQTIPAHTHNIKAIGGLSSSEPLFLDASQSFGKNAATDRTIIGSTSATTGGVVNSTAVNTAAECAASSVFTSYTSRFFCVGR